jgi:hypothetical protein
MKKLGEIVFIILVGQIILIGVILYMRFFLVPFLNWILGIKF